MPSYFENNRSFKSNIESVSHRALKMLAIINKLFKYRTQSNLLRLYKAYVRPLLEYASTVWSPQVQYLADDIERVQKRFCRMFPSLRSLSYRDQLSQLGLLSLKSRRIGSQLVTMFKMFKGTSGLKFDDFFTAQKVSTTRGHSARVITKYAKYNYRLHFFSIYIIPLWNQLLQDEMYSPSLASFKAKIKVFLQRYDLW